MRRLQTSGALPDASHRFLLLACMRIGNEASAGRRPLASAAFTTSTRQVSGKSDRQLKRVPWMPFMLSNKRECLVEISYLKYRLAGMRYIRLFLSAVGH